MDKEPINEVILTRLNKGELRALIRVYKFMLLSQNVPETLLAQVEIDAIHSQRKEPVV